MAGLAGHPAPPFATADLSVFASGNHLVRFPVRVPELADRSGVAGHGSFDGHHWPWLPTNVLRCQMAGLHSFAVTKPMRRSEEELAHVNKDTEVRRDLLLSVHLVAHPLIELHIFGQAAACIEAHLPQTERAGEFFCVR